ncbi:MAG: AarF/ABC1/UbiB kinase family protein [Gammaproteobacteria bacterium]|nr:AarF/ABC1/UbiB kinase family protein [Gammaproteobacteria bacterium]
MDAVGNTTHNPRRDSGMKAWLAVMEASLAAVEQTVWQGRELAEQALAATRAIAKGADAAREEYQALAREAAIWPQRLKRISRTGWMLTRVTGSYRLWGTRSAFISRRRLPAALEKLHRSNAIRFRETSLEQGGAFLKVGQLLSARADVLPKAWVDELAVLQDQARVESFSAIRHQVETELGDTLENLFLEFNPEPIAAASIGQVHKAILKDGRPVAVKVQRPGLEEIINLDMSLLKLFMASIENLLPPTDLATITTEIERTIREELDYRAEAKWMQRLGDFLRDVPGVIVPRPVQALSGKRVLISEFIEGRKLTTELDARQQAGDDKGLSDLLGRLLDLYLRQVLQAGCFQADPHPGNILVTADDKLVLLDFGCTMELSEQFRKGYANVLGAAMMGEKESVAASLQALGFKTRSGKPDTLLAFADALLSTLRNTATAVGGENPSWPSADDILQRGKALFSMADNDPVDKLPAEFIMLARVFTTLGGLFIHYKPKMDVTKYLLPHLIGPMVASVYP